MKKAVLDRFRRALTAVALAEHSVSVARHRHIHRLPDALRNYQQEGSRAPREFEVLRRFQPSRGTPVEFALINEHPTLHYILDALLLHQRCRVLVLRPHVVDAAARYLPRRRVQLVLAGVLLVDALRKPMHGAVAQVALAIEDKRRSHLSQLAAIGVQELALLRSELSFQQRFSFVHRYAF